MNIKKAIENVQDSGEVKVTRVSSFYETSPVDFLDQPHFINNVIEVSTSLNSRELLKRTRLAEAALNTKPRTPKGPRVVDLDILIYHDEKVNSEELKLPHPSICDRKFVLVPLLEVNPEAFCMLHNRIYRACLEKLVDPNQVVEIYHG